MINMQSDAVKSSSVELREFARRICMHIAASNPLYLNREDIPESARQKEEQLFRAQVFTIIIKYSLIKIVCIICSLVILFICLINLT